MLIPPIQLISNDTMAGTEAVELLCQAGISCNLIKSPHDCQFAPACRWLQPLSTELKTRLILDDAISTLEKTKHAFKSRDLSDLRRRLQELLETL